MPSFTVTPNYNFVLQGAGDNPGTWGTSGDITAPNEGGLNSAIFTPLDAILGNMLEVGATPPSTFLSVVNFQNAGFIVNGNISAPTTLVVPLSPTTSTPPIPCCGGKFIVANNTQSPGALVTVITAVSGSTGVVIPVGFAAEVYADVTTGNVFYASSGLPGYAAAFAGNPNATGAGLAGTAGSATTNASLAFDYVGQVLYVCITTGTATGSPTAQAVWANAVGGSIPISTPQGYLTPTSGVPIVPGDALAQSIIYYTPYVGSNLAIYNGTSIVSQRFTQLQYTVTGLIANAIYDVYVAYTTLNSLGTMVIGTGPAWAVSTAGSCSRGGGAAIQRDTTTGLWVNGTTMTFNWTGGSKSATAGQLVYLGSILIDSAGGTVSCYRSWGQNRYFGVWNAYNRVPITLLGGDSTAASWTYGGTPGQSWRQSHGLTANKIIPFTGLAEEIVQVTFNQTIAEPSTGSGTIGIGWNSTTGPVGYTPFSASSDTTTGGTGVALNPVYVAPPSLGINNANMLEIASTTSAATTTYYGGNPNMQMVVSYRG